MLVQKIKWWQFNKLKHQNNIKQYVNMQKNLLNKSKIFVENLKINKTNQKSKIKVF